VSDAEKIKVLLNVNGAFEEYSARILSTDKTNDLALLTIKDDKFRPLSSAPYSIIANAVDVGTSVFTMGYPMSNVLGNEVKITDGIISSKTGYEGDAVTYQISAPIQPGNSGGALFDKKGHLIGITNAGIPSADNVGYAIKSSYLINLIDSAPIDIPLPKGIDTTNKELSSVIKVYTPYIAFIKIY
jgi:S1-C subfamily serine protease